MYWQAKRKSSPLVLEWASTVLSRAHNVGAFWKRNENRGKNFGVTVQEVGS